jgi:acyl carrier protein
VADLTDSTLKRLLGLSDEADLNQPFSDLDVDSWDFIEARTVLETRFDMHFTDDEWMSLERPADILTRRGAA